MLAALDDLVARRGIAGPAVAIAIALGLWNAAESLSFALLEPLGVRGLMLDLGGARFPYGDLLVRSLALAPLVAAAVLLARSARTRLRSCPECLARIPRGARVCRACTTDLEPAP
jgi:ribosomal protein L40E